MPLLGGCNAVRLAYNNGPQLTWWWLDGYADFSREQTPAVKQSIDRFFEWHRTTQLPDYVALLASAQTAVVEPTTPAQACRWQERIREGLEPSLDRALVQLADIVPGLGEPQFRHIEQRYAKAVAELRDNYLQPDPAKRRAEAIKRTLERAERFYGNLDAAQKRVIAAGIDASPFNPEAWIADRQRQQRDTVQTLRRLVAERADADQRLAALRALAARTEASPDPVYRAYQVKLGEYNCGFVAQLHNATTAAQKRKAQETLKDWEDDLRAVIAGT